MINHNINLKNLRVALAHDYLIKNGGAERVLQVLHSLFPEAPVYTLVYDEKGTSGLYNDWKIKSSYLQNRLGIVKAINYYRALMPRAVESFDFNDYDLVISDASSYIKGVLTNTSTLHLCYMHTPTRFLWFDLDSHIKRGHFASWLKSAIPYILHRHRQWDFLAAERPDAIIANSETTSRRITKFYRRSSTIIYPPVNIDRFDNKKRDPRDYFLIVSRLEPHKNIDMAISACNNIGAKLVIVGTGSDLENLKSIAGPTVQFLGHLSDQAIEQHLYQAKAFLSPQVEDFGITMVEALAAGCPVIANATGGAAEIVKDGINGILIKEINGNKLAQVLSHFNPIEFNQEECSQSAKKFSQSAFEDQIMKFINAKLTERSKNGS